MYVADDSVENSTVKLTLEIETKISAFNFANVHWLDARPARMPALASSAEKTFDFKPPMTVPSEQDYSQPKVSEPALIITSQSAGRGP